MKRLIASLSLMIALLFPVGAAAAYSPLGGACRAGGGASSSSACSVTHGNPNPLTGPNGIIRKVTTVIAWIAGVAAVIIIIVAGFQFVTSDGNAEEAAKARSALIGGLIGLVIVLGAQAMVIFILKLVK